MTPPKGRPAPAGKPNRREVRNSRSSTTGEMPLTEPEVDGFLSKLTMRSQDILDNASHGTINLFRRLGGKRESPGGRGGVGGWWTGGA